MFKNLWKTCVIFFSQDDEKELLKWEKIPGNRFTKIKVLGVGGFGTVDLYNFKPHDKAKEEEFEKRVIKRLKADKNSDINFNNEILPLLRLKHPNIVRLMGETTIEGYRGIVLEYLEGGDLNDVIHNRTPYRYSLRDVLSWSIQSARALEYMHSFNDKEGEKYTGKPPPYSHRDIKPQNMLLDSTCQILKIADFGLSKELTSAINTKGCGTCFYMAPEVFTSKNYVETCDVYSWTLTFWECLTGLQPFKECKNMGELEEKKLKENYLANVSTASDRLNRLIQSGSSKDPKNRISMKSWRRILEILIKNCDLLEKQKQDKFIIEERKNDKDFRDPYVWILNEGLTGEFFYCDGLEKYQWATFSPKSMEKFLDDQEKQQKHFEKQQMQLLLAKLEKQGI